MSVRVAKTVEGLKRPIAIEALYLAGRYLSEARTAHGIGHEPDIKSAEAARVAKEIVALIEKTEGRDIGDLSREQISSYVNEINGALLKYAEGSVSNVDVDSVLSELRSMRVSPSPQSESIKARAQIHLVTDELISVFNQQIGPEDREPAIQNEERRFDRRYGHYSNYELEVLNDRLGEIKIAYRAFKKAKLHEKRNINFVLSQSVIITVCALHLNDLKTFKLGHVPEPENESTLRSASIARWIAKLRPIQLEDEPQLKVSPLRDVMFVNEDFATYMFLLYLRFFELKSLPHDGVTKILWQLRNLFVHGDPNVGVMRALAAVTQELISAWAKSRAD
jgi:hypothetical protein